MVDVIKNPSALWKQAREGLVSGSVHWPQTLQQKAEQPLSRRHFRFRHADRQTSALHCLVLDCSGSMLTGSNLALAKGLLLQWTRQIYRQRAQICVIGFAGEHAHILQTPRKAAAMNEDWIAPIRGGGGTPIVKGLQLAQRILDQAIKKSHTRVTGLWLVTDGRFPELPPRPHPANHCIVVDFENAAVRLGRAQQLAQDWQADYVPASTFFSNQPYN